MPGWRIMNGVAIGALDAAIQAPPPPHGASRLRSIGVGEASAPMPEAKAGGAYVTARSPECSSKPNIRS
jgi:hypothetical protein